MAFNSDIETECFSPENVSSEQTGTLLAKAIICEESAVAALMRATAGQITLLAQESKNSSSILQLEEWLEFNQSLLGTMDSIVVVSWMLLKKRSIINQIQHLKNQPRPCNISDQFEQAFQVLANSIVYWINWLTQLAKSKPALVENPEQQIVELLSFIYDLSVCSHRYGQSIDQHDQSVEWRAALNRIVLTYHYQDNESLAKVKLYLFKIRQEYICKDPAEPSLPFINSLKMPKWRHKK